jgi:hypothetical protein
VAPRVLRLAGPYRAVGHGSVTRVADTDDEKSVADVLDDFGLRIERDIDADEIEGRARVAAVLVQRARSERETEEQAARLESDA